MRVGEHKKAYVVHKDLLFLYSDCFRAMFESFREALENAVELPDTTEETFDLFILWLYTRRLRDDDDQDNDGNNANGDSSTIVHESIILWIFADKYQIPLLQNNIIDMLLERFKNGAAKLSWLTVNMAYDNTVASSPLRKMITDVMAYCVEFDNAGFTNRWQNGQGSLNSESLLDVVKAMETAWMTKMTKGVLPKRHKCYYHIHSKTDRCEPL